MNYNAFRDISYGVYIISTWDNGRPTGCTANSVMQVTSDPATIAVSINHHNYTNECIDRSGRFAISVLAEDSAPPVIGTFAVGASRVNILAFNSTQSIIGTFGFQSGKDVDKFDTVKYEIKDMMPIVAAGCAYITCEVIDRMETDTHTVFLGKVVDADFLSKAEPMTYAYYHKVIKGKSPKNAPTYIAKESTEPLAHNVFRCSICGYEYSGPVPFEELPDDYTCPICGQPKSAFQKQV